MKIRTLNFQFFSNRIETLDFKKFCEGGSLEYVAAKQKLNNLYHQQQASSPYKSLGEKSPSVSLNTKSRSVTSRHFRPLTAYSLYINPLGFFDIHFLIATGCVVLLAVLERKLANNGIIAPAAILSGVLKVGFPLVAFGSILVLISKLGVFL